MEKKKFWTYENKITILFFLVVGFVFFDRLAINYLIPFMQGDFPLSNTQIGLASAALALTWSIAGPLGGLLSDKVKSKKTVLAIFVLLFSIISLLHGLVASFAMLFILRLIMGLAEGPIIPITQSVIAIESSENRRGFNTGFTMNTANALFGSLLAPVIIVALASKFDWHTAFYLTIIPGAILAIVILKTMRNPQKLEEEAKQLEKKKEKTNYKEVLKHRNIWLSVVIFSLFMSALMAFSIYTPTYLVTVKGLTPGTMSLVMAAFGAGYAIFGLLIPALSDKIGRKVTYTIFSTLSILLPLAVLYIQSVPMLMAAVFIFAAGPSVGSIVMSAIPVESVPFKFAGIAVGLTIGIGELFGGFLTPILSGMAGDAFGLQAVMFISSGAAALAFLCSFFLIETLPSKAAKPQQQAATIPVQP